MFWLIWQMFALLLIAFVGGVSAGWWTWSSNGRSAEADEALAEVARLRHENDALARRLGEAEARVGVAEMRSDEPVKTAHVEVLPGDGPDLEDPEPIVRDDLTVKDDLTALKGLGPKAAASLIAGGVTRFDQIAAWTDADIASWDERIQGRGRIVRDDWVGQARALS
jgi:predicted flap endonuclease-1-like 5' DNA nuclease